MLNKWRCTGYTEDGCYGYQCLACKSTWEARTDAADWVYCPRCGTKWDGTAAPTGDIPYGPRRARVREAMYRRALGKPKPPEFLWIVEERVTWDGKAPGEWDVVYRINGEAASAREVYKYLQMVKVAHRASGLRQLTCEARVRTTRRVT